MSARDVLRSFAETSMADGVPIIDGVTYGDVREAVDTLQRTDEAIVTMLELLQRWRNMSPLGRGAAGYGRLCIETDTLLQAVKVELPGAKP
jgi:hypothetical protein